MTLQESQDWGFEDLPPTHPSSDELYALAEEETS